MTTVTIQEWFDMNNGKTRADVCLEFGLVSSATQNVLKNRTKIINAF